LAGFHTSLICLIIMQHMRLSKKIFQQVKCNEKIFIGIERHFLNSRSHHLCCKKKQLTWMWKKLFHVTHQGLKLRSIKQRIFFNQISFKDYMFTPENVQQKIFPFVKFLHLKISNLQTNQRKLCYFISICCSDNIWKIFFLILTFSLLKLPS